MLLPYLFGGALVAGAGGAAGSEPAPLDFAVRSGQGLHLSVAGVPVVRGSWFQYIEPDWSKSYYRSSASQQQIETLPNGDIRVSFRSQDGLAFGVQTYRRTQQGISVIYEFNWQGEQPVKVELTGGALWAPAFQQGRLRIDGTDARSLLATRYNDATIPTRAYGINAREFEFDAPLGRVRVTGSQPQWTLFDARGYPQAWAENRETLWLGVLSLNLNPGETARTRLDWFVEPKLAERRVETHRMTAVRAVEALHPPADELPIIPRPKQALFNRQDPLLLDLSLGVDAPDWLRPFRQELREALGLLWQLPEEPPTPKGEPQLIIRIQDLNLPAEGYEIRVTNKHAMLLGQDEAGLRHAVRTLAMLAFAKDGKLYLPGGSMRDWPSIGWRGVHLFGGPSALTFHNQIAHRVLAPLKLNRVVFQCERTRWESFPGIWIDNMTPREDLRKIFDMYRQIGFEPIPLVQSFGHMSWFFANGQNLDLAINPEVPFAIDPRKPESQEALRKLWAEVIDVTRAKTVHFGLDEVDIRGFQRDPELVTQLWERHLPFLSSIARQHDVRMMLWGDKGLAPGEAIDAAHGDSFAHARRRRAAIPLGAMIADWHYRNDPNPDRFLSSLNIWKNAGMKPVASTWFRPENIRGFYLAAYRMGAGTLQTLWAGHGSSEEAVLREFRQFAAMVVAADYSWSARPCNWNELDYDPWEIFSRMFWRRPAPLTSQPGFALAGNGFRPQRIGDVTFRLFEPIALSSMLSERSSNRPLAVEIETTGLIGKEIAIAIDSAIACEEGDPLADLEIEMADGTVIFERLHYGRHARAQSDARAVAIGRRANGITAMRMKIADEPVEIVKISLRGVNRYAGVRLHGVTAF